MSPDQNRQRPRSSKKQRAVQRGTSQRGPATARVGSTATARVGPTPTQRAVGRGTRGGGASSGIPTAWLAAIAVVVFVAGVVLASGAIKFGGVAASVGPSESAAADASTAPSGSTPSGSTTARGSGCPTAQPPAAPAGQTRVVTIETAKGKFQITLKADLSPIAVGNFAALAACGFYDGIVFHRVATLQDGTPFVIQGGDPTGTGGGGPGYSILDEPVTAKYVRGTVAMARSSGPNSVGSQFFIVLDDKDQSVLAAYNTYQIIGSVTSGMETVDAIYQAAGGQEAPASPVAMDKVTTSNP